MIAARPGSFKRRLWQALLWSALCVGIGTGLSGCVPVDHISVRLIDEQLVIVLCDGEPFNQLTVAVTPKDIKPYEPTNSWVASGPLSRSQEPIQYGVPPAEMTTDLGPDALTPSGNFIDVFAGEVDSRGVRVSGAYGVFDGDEMSSDYWLTATGSRADAPCD